MIAMTSLARALRYELFRLRTTVSIRVLTVLALLAVALITLPAARDLSAQPGGSRLAGYGAISWVVGGGRAGAVLPGCVAGAVAAWLGASSVDYDYRHGTALALYASIPRRGAVLLAKALVVATFGIMLQLAASALAFGTATLGFVMAGSGRSLPAGAALAAPAALVAAAGCGVFALLLTSVVRVRLVAWAGTLGLAAAVAAIAVGPSGQWFTGMSGANSGANPRAYPNAYPSAGAGAGSGANPGAWSADPFAAPLGRMADRLVASVRLPGGAMPDRLVVPVLFCGLLLLVVTAARCSVGRRRAQ